MTKTLRSVVIGCGVGGQGRAGVHSIGYLHGETYRQSDDVELVAAADLVEENARRYAEYFGFERTYTDFREMLHAEKPDIVSVCTWPPLHAEMVIAAAEAGAKGIWSEKPMALSMHEVDAMLRACEENGARLVVDHQRRYLPQFREARRLIAEGQIGEVLTIHAGIEGWDLLSWGTHWVDMYRFLLGERRCEWVVAQVDVRNQVKKYGHLVEDHALSCFAFEGGTHAFLETGRTVSKAPTMRIAGSDGVIDILQSSSVSPDAPALRYFSPETNGWISPELPATRDFVSATGSLLSDLVKWIHGGPEPAVSGSGARATTEMILAAYESARQRAIIELPLEARDFPLAELAELTQVEHPVAP